MGVRAACAIRFLGRGSTKVAAGPGPQSTACDQPSSWAVPCHGHVGPTKCCGGLVGGISESNLKGLLSHPPFGGLRSKPARSEWCDGPGRKRARPQLMRRGHTLFGFGGRSCVHDIPWLTLETPLLVVTFTAKRGEAAPRNGAIAAFRGIVMGILNKLPTFRLFKTKTASNDQRWTGEFFEFCTRLCFERASRSHNHHIFYSNFLESRSLIGFISCELPKTHVLSKTVAGSTYNFWKDRPERGSHSPSRPC